jgi:hypothetical protein
LSKHQIDVTGLSVSMTARGNLERTHRLMGASGMMRKRSRRDVSNPHLSRPPTLPGSMLYDQSIKQ